MNWAGPGYDDVGMELVDSLWASGIPADLIPTTEIKHMEVDSEGWIPYGPQKYAALVLYHPEFENPDAAGFFSSAAGGKTLMMRMGNWTMDFNGLTFNGAGALPASMAEYPDIETILQEIHQVLIEKGIPIHSPANNQMKSFGYMSNCPPATGHCRLIDGTIIHIAGSEKVSGDPIIGDKGVKGQKAWFDAIGLAAYRMDERGQVLRSGCRRAEEFPERIP